MIVLSPMTIISRRKMSMSADVAMPRRSMAGVALAAMSPATCNADSISGAPPNSTCNCIIDGGKPAAPAADAEPVASPMTAPPANEGLRAAPAARPAIAVLPFANLSADPEQQYFSNGITEDIITELSRYRSLLVIARNSSFQFRGPPVDIAAVREKLGIRFVVEGSVRRIGTRLRLTAQLIDAIALFAARRYEDAIEALGHMPSLYAWDHAYLTACHAYLDHAAEAHTAVFEVLEPDPAFTIGRYAKIEGYAQPADLQHLCEGMRKGGLPD